MRLEGMHAIVTGAGSGIGRAAARLFAAEGAAVVAVDLQPEAAEATASEIGGTAIAGSVADPEVWDAALAVHDGTDVAYLNAGLYGFNGPIDELPLDVYRSTIAANVDGVVLGTRAVVPAMEARGGGAIVVTASVAGIVAFEPNPVYTLTKQAVTGFVRAVAPSLAPRGITIDAVCPGVVDTPMTVLATGGAGAEALGIPVLSPEAIAEQALDLATTDGTGRCRAVRESAPTVDWTFPTWVDLARAAETQDQT
jgi:NAD(P)-dependent dehydrogenase (short-subunit alcohol dehydrogenase family)